MRKETCGGKRKNVFSLLYFSFLLQAEIFTPAHVFHLLNHEENLGLFIVYGMKNLSVNEEELAGT